MKTIKYLIFGLVITLGFSAQQANALVSTVNVDANVQADMYGNKASSTNSEGDIIKLNVGTDVTAGVDSNVTYHTDSEANASPAVDTSSDNKVVVTYKRPAKLFGFIKVYITEKATVSGDSDAKAHVRVSKSWWSFLASSDTHSAELSSAIQSRIASDNSVSAKGELSADAKARYAADIQAAAQATYNK